MSYLISEIDLKTNWPVAEALDWIKANKTTEAQSKELADKILGTINVTGLVQFQEKFIK